MPRVGDTWVSITSKHMGQRRIVTKVTSIKVVSMPVHHASNSHMNSLASVPIERFIRSNRLLKAGT